MRNIILLFAILFSLSSYSQRHDFGLHSGVSYYLGDLIPIRHFGVPGPNFGLIYRYEANKRIAVRIAANHGIVRGNSDLNRPNLRYKNLDFFSPITSIDMGIEINFLEFEAGKDRNRFTPFIFGGFSAFKFNPQVEFNGRIYELQPLGTEGQGTTAYPDRDPYKLMSWSIPFGGGIKLSLGRIVTIGLDWTVYKTFTDYLDDISTTYPDPALLAAEKSPVAAMLSIRRYESWAADQGLNISLGSDGMPLNQNDYSTYLEKLTQSAGSQRGNSENMDWYGVAGFTITFKLVGPKKKTCPAYKKHFYFKEYKLF